MFAKSLKLLSISFLVGEVFLSLQSDKRGPYEVIVKSLVDCGHEGAQSRWHTKWRKQSRTTTVIEGGFSINFTVNNDIKLRAVMQKLTQNGWKDNYMNFDFGDVGICDLVKEFVEEKDEERISDILLGENNSTLDKICNMPPGEYTLTKPVELRFEGYKGFPVFFYGTYRTRAMVYYKDFDHEVGCGWSHFDIVPKRKKNG